MATAVKTADDAERHLPALATGRLLGLRCVGFCVVAVLVEKHPNLRGERLERVNTRGLLANEAEKVDLASVGRVVGVADDSNSPLHLSPPVIDVSAPAEAGLIVAIGQDEEDPPEDQTGPSTRS